MGDNTWREKCNAGKNVEVGDGVGEGEGRTSSSHLRVGAPELHLYPYLGSTGMVPYAQPQDCAA